MQGTEAVSEVMDVAKAVRRPILAVAAALVAGACAGDPAGPEATGSGTPDDPPVSTEFEEQVAADEAVAEAMIEDAALWVSADPATGPWAEARELFRQARRAWRSGDTERAAEFAYEGRLVLARALIERRGEEGLDALEGHVEALLTRLEEAANDYARAEALAERLAELLEESRTLRADGDLVGAAERLILALAIADRMRHRVDDGRDAEVVAERAVAVATAVHRRVSDAIGPDAGPRVRHALAHSRELLRRANAALEREAWRRAVVLARRSVGWALHALRIYQA